MIFRVTDYLCSDLAWMEDKSRGKFQGVRCVLGAVGKHRFAVAAGISEALSPVPPYGRQACSRYAAPCASLKHSEHTACHLPCHDFCLPQKTTRSTAPLSIHAPLNPVSALDPHQKSWCAHLVSRVRYSFVCMPQRGTTHRTSHPPAAAAAEPGIPLAPRQRRADRQYPRPCRDRERRALEPVDSGNAR